MPDSQHGALVDVRSLASELDVSEPTIWRWLKDEAMQFPKPLKIGKNSTRWLRTEVEGWITARAAQRNAEARA